MIYISKNDKFNDVFKYYINDNKYDEIRLILYMIEVL